MRERVELSKVFEGIGGSIFYDVGWAGSPEDFDSSEVLSAAGIGVTVFDGLLRLDLANGLRGSERRFRLHLYADGIL